MTYDLFSKIAMGATNNALQMQSLREGLAQLCAGLRKASWPWLQHLAWLASLAMVLLQAPGAFAQDLTLKRFSLEDKGGVLSIEQASQSLAYEAMGITLNEGGTASVYWVKLVLQPQNSDRTLHLRMKPTALDSVTLFVPTPTQGSNFVQHNLDERLAQADSPLLLEAGVDTLFIRFKTTGLMLVSPKLMTPAQADRSNVVEARFVGGLSILYLTFLLYALWTAKQKQDPSIYFFVLNLLAINAQLTMHFNLVAEWMFIQPDNSKFITRATNLLNVFTLGLFIYAVFHHYGAPRILRYTAKGAAYLIGSLLALYLLTRSQNALSTGLALGVFYTFVAMPMVVYLFYKTLSPSTNLYLALAFSIYSVILVLFIYSDFLNEVVPFLNLADLIAWRSVVIVPFVIWFIVTVARQTQAESNRELVIKTEALTRAEDEKNRRVQQTEFLSMLLHELKTPLSIIQFATGHLTAPVVDEAVKQKKVVNILKSVDDINFIIERCVEFDSAALEAEPKCERIQMKDLMDEVLRPIDTERLIFDLEKDQVIFSDFQFLRIILTNILTNAIKYSRDDTAVELCIERNNGNDGYIFTVINEIGADGAPEAGKVFSRYYRAEGAKKKPGVGLGLWLSQTLAHKIASRVQFSTDGLRVKFELIVPNHAAE